MSLDFWAGYYTGYLIASIMILGTQFIYTTLKHRREMKRLIAETEETIRKQNEDLDQKLRDLNTDHILRMWEIERMNGGHHES